VRAGGGFVAAFVTNVVRIYKQLIVIIIIIIIDIHIRRRRHKPPVSLLTCLNTSCTLYTKQSLQQQRQQHQQQQRPACLPA
jgi:hypothetical protein